MEKNLKKNIHTYMYNWITLLYTWRNIVNQLYLKKKNLTKEVKVLYSENYKTLMKEIK